MTYFVAGIVASIVCYYDELATSWPIPDKYSLAQLGESVALELYGSCATFVPTTLSSTVGGSGAAQSIGDPEHGVGGNKADRCDAEGRAVGVVGVDILWYFHFPKANAFETSYQQSYVDTFITPKKSKHQQSTIRQAARNFLRHPIVMDIQSKAYDPYEEISLDSENKTRMSFHGTRKSRLHRFKTNGVDLNGRQMNCPQIVLSIPPIQ